MLSKFIKAATNPSRTYEILKAKTKSVDPNIEYVAIEPNRSVSDNGTYVGFVQSAIKDYKSFLTFKRHPKYREILEHVSQDDGQKYLDVVQRQSPEFFEIISKFKDNDLVGSPVTHRYDGIGEISPTTLRYMKVASDLKSLFGDQIGQKIAEIGVGYGGQLLVNDRVFNMRQYDLFDLPPVLNLVSKYLECHILNCSYRTSTLNQCPVGETYDLVISNYAFSELPSQLQLKYIEKIISRSTKGYLTMDSCYLEDSKMSLEDLRKHLPRFEIYPETPLTHSGNYIIVWGRNVRHEEVADIGWEKPTDRHH